MTQEQKIYSALVNALNYTYESWVIINDLQVDDKYIDKVSEIETEIYDSLESMQDLVCKIKELLK